METTTTLGDAIARLEHEIDDRQRALAVLKAMVRSDAPPPTHHEKMNGTTKRGATSDPQSKTVGGAAADILRTAGRPMHALREILPLIQEKGIAVSKTTLPTALGRRKDLKKIEPGVWTYAGPTQ